MEIVSITKRTPGDFPALDDLKSGDKLIADCGFTCLREGEVVIVQQDADGLFVPCCEHETGEYGKPADDTREQQHYLEGQRGCNGECVGLFLAMEGDV
jgi:hypothetical protein